MGLLASYATRLNASSASGTVPPLAAYPELGGGLTTSGTSAALTLASGQAFSAYADGLAFAVRMHADAVANATLAVNGKPAKPIVVRTPSGERRVRSGEMITGLRYILHYDALAQGGAGAWTLYGTHAAEATALADAGGVEVTATTVAVLRTIAPRAGMRVRTAGYYAAGDRGDGLYVAEIGAPGTYVDNAGWIIVPTGGDGSAAWILTGRWRQEQFGAVGDATLPLGGKMVTATSTGTAVVTVASTDGLAEGMEVCSVRWHSQPSTAIATPTTIAEILSATSVRMSRTIPAGVHRLNCWRKINPATVGGTDNSASIDVMVAGMIATGRSDADLPQRPGIYHYPTGIQIGDGLGFREIRLHGPHKAQFAAAIGGAAYVFTATDRPGVSITGGRRSGIVAAALYGPIYNYIQALLDVNELAPDTLDWLPPTLPWGGTVPGGLNRRSPLAGIAVDPYAGIAPVAPYGRVLPAGVPTAYGMPLTSEPVMDRCQIMGFAIGTITGPNSPNQGDFERATECFIGACVIASGVYNTQARNQTRGHNLLNGVKTAVSGSLYGDGSGKCNGVFDNLSGSLVYELFDFDVSAFSGVVEFHRIYIEIMGRLGRFVGSAGYNYPLALVGCEFLTGTDLTGEVPAAMIETGERQSVVLDRCAIVGPPRIIAITQGGNPDLTVRDCILRGAEFGPPAAETLPMLRYCGGWLTGSSRFNTNGVDRSRWEGQTTVPFAEYADGALSTRRMGDELYFFTSAGRRARMPKDQAVKRFRARSGRLWTLRQVTDALLAMDSTYTLEDLTWTGIDTARFTLKSAVWGWGSGYRLAVGWGLYHTATATIFVVTSVGAPDGSGNRLVTIKQENNLRLDVTTGATQINYLSDLALSGYLIIVQPDLVLTEEVYVATATAGSATLTNAGRGDGFAGQMTDSIFVGDALRGSIYGEDWFISDQPTTIAGRTAGSPGTIVLSRAADRSGTYPITCVPIH
ncbi:hypothetical protein [Oharaeibacter diazotrophicus]|uniref:Uncharacterized protein n=1 Tax=Oharaeibacter diazotrophicus TaxID=1920512 RepID=A0A4R6RGD5_9HYPH|nr:hypothetical protein [Oharaeibacter diazotrophicus]TDP85403.1 hypothetical protein EDD54_2256 [Oharaeibacter diazotrophicus]BBE74373.1 hypothetical protein OHA_1_04004 [Pleomorphomonas sp. SM30]GLS75934.1 hypothetical protein GCM10007904_12690 [Oharaeibacter diazotrophicus]